MLGTVERTPVQAARSARLAAPEHSRGSSSASRAVPSPDCHLQPHLGCCVDKRRWRARLSGGRAERRLPQHPVWVSMGEVLNDGQGLLWLGRGRGERPKSRTTHVSLARAPQWWHRAQLRRARCSRGLEERLGMRSGHAESEVCVRHTRGGGRRPYASELCMEPSLSALRLSPAEN